MLLHRISIALISGDLLLKGELERHFRNHQILHIPDAEQIDPLIEKFSPNIIILDLAIANGTSLLLIRPIRTETQAPIILVTGQFSMSDKIMGLELGADDYLTKPISIRELAVHIKAILRRSHAPEFQGGARLFVGDWVLDRNALQAYDHDGKSAGLTVQEFRLLEALALSQDRILSRNQLLSKIGKDDADVFDRSIDVQIARIRRKLGDAGRTPALIRTVRSMGYSLAVPVSRDISLPAFRKPPPETATDYFY